MTRKTILQTTLILLITGLAFTAPIADAYAKGALLFVSPNRVVLPPNQRATVVNVTNKDDRTREFKIVAENYIMTENATTQLVDDFEYSAAKMIRYVPRRIKLGPGERQSVRIMAKKPSGLEDGDYHAHILFQELPPAPMKEEGDGNTKENQLAFKIEALYSMAIPIVVQHGALHSELTITGAELHAKENDMYEAVVALDRNGNSEGTGYLTIEQTQADGSIKMVGLGGELHIYREADKVKRSVPLQIEGEIDVNQLRAVLRDGNKLTDRVISSQPIILTTVHSIEVEK